MRDALSKRLSEYTATCPAPINATDEYYCTRCMLRWDTHEDKPPCPKQKDQGNGS